MEEVITLWQPIHFSEKWMKSNTSILDDLTPSWFRRRAELKDGNEDYEEFLERLKRQHAIETGVIEKLYDLTEGITQTFIKEGFVESYLSHDDTNIPPQQLMGFLKDHFEAMDFIFDLVKNERPLTTSFICELHQLITKNQDFVIAIDTLGRIGQVKLLKGKYKETENNPKRQDGKLYKYCPPLDVPPEMIKLIEIHNDLWNRNINPVIIAAFIHHAFTQIHPFQDGNGRIARLLASLILIRGNLFPFTVRRDEKVNYINALEKADSGEPQELVTFFCEIQKRNIENALNYKTEKSQASMAEVAKLFAEKIDVFNSHVREERQSVLEKNRRLIFDNISNVMGEIKKELYSFIPYEKARINIDIVRPNDEKYFWHTQQIVKYATVHNYYFNRYHPRGWFKISFSVSQDKRYDLIISVHHYSYDDSIIAVGAFIEFTESIAEGEISDKDKDARTTIPINLKPYTISLEKDLTKDMGNLEQYIRDVTKIGLSLIANEII